MSSHNYTCTNHNICAEHSLYCRFLYLVVYCGHFKSNNYFLLSLSISPWPAWPTCNSITVTSLSPLPISIHVIVHKLLITYMYILAPLWLFPVTIYCGKDFLQQSNPDSVTVTTVLHVLCEITKVKADTVLH